MGMNKGQRGSALGFRVASLAKMADTKASTNKNMTLLHYLVEIADKKFPDIMKLEEETPHLHEASKVNVADLEKEISNLRVGLKNIEKEISFFEERLCLTSPDKFVHVMKDFCTVAACTFSSVEDQCQDMKSQYEKLLKTFSEDS